MLGLLATSVLGADGELTVGTIRGAVVAEGGGRDDT